MTPVTAASRTRTRTRRGPDFLIVGTPRSGTTLVQRLACELPRIGMPPETHFLGFYALEMLRRRSFPLAGAELEDEIKTFASLEKSIELNVDVAAVYAALEGRADSPLELFGAIVRSLAGEADLYGEKSPEHLLWWRPLAATEVKVITVVRDPRAVVTSMLEAWAPQPQRGIDHHVLRAERWAADQRIAIAAQEVLGDERNLVLRYEDVVADHVAARARIASFLGITISLADDDVTAAPEHIVLPRESWKARTFAAITDERVSAWRSALTPQQHASIASVCADGMRHFGYGSDAGAAPKLSPRTQWRRARFRAGRYRQQRRIDRSVL